MPGRIPILRAYVMYSSGVFYAEKMLSSLIPILTLVKKFFQVAAVLFTVLFLPFTGTVCRALPLSSGYGERPVRFAFITDVHIAVNAPSVEDLRLCIRDLNRQESLDFVVFGGDITDFGSDEEIALAKSIIDSLKVRHYVLAGNHDANWSESGCNTFLSVFGYEQFCFEEGGWRFIGCNSGPDMRMSPALVPHESMVWLENLPKGRKSIFMNHYPMDSSVLNYSDVTRTLKALDVRFEIGGHWHANTALNYGGIPAVLGRSGMSGNGAAGYNIIELYEDSVAVAERRVYPHSAVLMEPWYTARLSPVKDTVSYDAHGLPADYPWMRYDVNDTYPGVKEIWTFQDEYNIVAGSAISGDTAFYTTSSGFVRAISLRDGKTVWSRKFPGKIFSTPAVEGKTLVVGCSDGKIYALGTSDGEILWSHSARKSVVASPVIRNGKVYIGASDGAFRCLSLRDGSLVWEYSEVEGHQASTPFIDGQQVVFGTWGRKLYSLDPDTGALQWVWTVGRPVRNYSPASCVPVKAGGKIFVAVPDRRIYAIDARTGEQAFFVEGGRDALGMSEDGTKIFSKTMFHKTYAISPDSPEKIWEKENMTGYEIAPTALVEKDGVLFIPTCKGNLIAMSSETGDVLWAHKLSIALINPLQVWREGKDFRILATAMDGRVTLLSVPASYNKK